MINVNLQAITAQMIQASIRDADLDAALQPLMAVAGILHGDVAAAHFASVMDSDNSQWQEGTFEQREAFIRSWMDHEAAALRRQTRAGFVELAARTYDDGTTVVVDQEEPEIRLAVEPPGAQRAWVKAWVWVDQQAS